MIPGRLARQHWSGRWRRASIHPDEPLLVSDVRPAVDESGRRAMSIAIPAANAVGGELAAGDIVDVLVVTDDRTRFVADQVPVLAVPAPASSGLVTSAGGWWVTLGGGGPGSVGDRRRCRARHRLPAPIHRHSRPHRPRAARPSVDVIADTGGGTDETRTTAVARLLSARVGDRSHPVGGRAWRCPAGRSGADRRRCQPESDFDVLVIDGWSSLLSRRLVTEAQRERGRGDGAGPTPTSRAPTKLGRDGCDACRCRCRPPPNRSCPAPRRSPPSAGPDVPTTDGASTTIAAGRRAGAHPSCVAVLGTGDVTEMAVNLAATVAGMGQSVALVDFDTVEPTIAQRLELPLIPNLLTAAEAIRDAEFGPSQVSTARGRVRGDRPGWRTHGSGTPTARSKPTNWPTRSAARYGLGSVCREPHAGRPRPAVAGWRHASTWPVGSCRRADEVMAWSCRSTPLGLTHGLNLIADVRSHHPGPDPSGRRLRTPKAGLPTGRMERELNRPSTRWHSTSSPTDPQAARAAWDGRLPTRGPYVESGAAAWRRAW